MRTLLSLLLLLLINSLSSQAQAQPAGRSMLQPAAMQEDFNYLRKMLETTHPGLYVHHTREAMQYKMDSLGRQLGQPLSLLEFYKKIAFLIAEVRCEHTYTNFGKGFNELIQSAKLLPLQLYFLSGKAYIVVNCTSDPSIQLGDELLTINGYPVDSIKHMLYQYMPSDGYMLSSKEQELDGMKFNILYWLFIEQPGEYRVTILKKDGSIMAKSWKKNLALKKLNQLAVKNPANKKVLEIDRTYKEKQKQALQLEWLEEHTTALLTVRSFSLEKDQFIPGINNFFDSLANKNLPFLIIDISNNGGGDEELAAALLSYFISKPTRLIENEYLITDSDAHFAISNIPDDVRKNKYDFIGPLAGGRSDVKITKYSQELKMLEPKPNRFKGKVYVYVNGKTSSAASTFAAVMKSNGLAKIVGEETAGSYTGGGTTNGLDLVLPNSKITAHTSIVYQVFATKGGDGNRGVLPDYPYLPSFDNLINGNLGWRNYILTLNKSSDR